MVIFLNVRWTSAVTSITRYIRNIIRPSSAKNRCEDAEPTRRFEPMNRDLPLEKNATARFPITPRQNASDDTLRALSQCRFYHTMDLPELGTVTGDWDLRGRFDEYIGGVNLAGRSVLDVGTASGFLTFEAEKRGAKVTSFDADSPDRWQTVPPANVDTAYFHGMRNGYALAHRLIGSRAQTLYGNIYDLAALAEPHDVLIVAQILVHLRDPLLALEQAARTTRDTLVIVEGVLETGSDAPLALYLGGAMRWWSLSIALYHQWLNAFGFKIDSTLTAYYPCDVAAYMPAITTIVARRS